MADLPQKLKRGRKAGRAYVKTGRPPGHPRGRRNLSASNGCKVCKSPDVELVNFALARGIGPHAVAARYGLPVHSVVRHWSRPDHVSPTYRQLVASGPYAKIDDLLTQVATADLKTLDVLDVMLAGHFNRWALAHNEGAERPSVVHGNQTLKLLRLRSEIT